jgi:hypothetical protein
VSTNTALPLLAAGRNCPVAHFLAMLSNTFFQFLAVRQRFRRISCLAVNRYAARATPSESI